MERADDHLFNEIISACEDKKNKALMGFKKNWNKELIAQFYATMHFGFVEGDRAMFWMTEGKYYKVNFSQFVRVLKLDKYDVNRPKIHKQNPLPVEEMKFMYPRRAASNAGKLTGLYIYYSILNRLLTTTLTPRGGKL
jgi:hypothetical protein